MWFDHAAVYVSFPIEAAVFTIEHCFDQIGISIRGAHKVVVVWRAVTKEMRMREHPDQSCLRNHAAHSLVLIMVFTLNQRTNLCTPGAFARIVNSITSTRVPSRVVPIGQHLISKQRFPFKRSLLRNLCAFLCLFVAKHCSSLQRAYDRVWPSTLAHNQ